MMKRKMLIPMIALLLSVGMIGVGFATWMISNEDVKTDNKGDFKVHKVENNSITMTIDMSDDDINFGPATKTASGNWLSFNGDAAEDLSATLKITVNEWATLKTKTINLEVKDFAILNADTFAGKGNSQYIKLPENQSITVAPSGNTWTVKVGDKDLAGASVDGTNGIITIPLNFAWGTMMGDPAVNPINYFNNLPNNAGNRKDAEDFLTEIYKLNGAQYQFTVAATVSAN